MILYANMITIINIHLPIATNFTIFISFLIIYYNSIIIFKNDEYSFTPK